MNAVHGYSPVRTMAGSQIQLPWSWDLLTPPTLMSVPEQWLCLEGRYIIRVGGELWVNWYLRTPLLATA